MKTPNIFISHRWAYSDDYYSLVTKLNNINWHHYDYSVPQHDPFDANRTRQIESLLQEQVRQSNFFIVFAQMAMNNSYWVQKEVQFAQYYGKYILGVKPWNYQGNIPKFLQDACNDIIGFNIPPIIRRIELQLS